MKGFLSGVLVAAVLCGCMFMFLYQLAESLPPVPGEAVVAIQVHK